MEPIIAPIKTDDTGAAVANLQDALLALLEQKKILQPPGTTGLLTPDERQKLTEGLKQERGQSLFGKATQQLIIDFQVQQGLPGNVHDLGVEEKTAEKLNELLKAIGAFDAPASTGFVVRGQVRLADGTPVAGALVRAYDKDMRTKEQLGKPEPVTADTAGRFEITYTAEQFSRVEKGNADLLVEARRNKETDWIAAPIRFNAQPIEIVDITLDGVYRGPSEFRRLVDEITPLLDGLTMAQLTESSDFQDITFLSNETGVDRQLVAWLAVSALRVEEEDLLQHEEYYGLFRQNLPTDLDALLEQQTDALRKAIENCARDNLIRPLLEQDLNDFVARVLQLKAGRALRPARPNEPGSLGDLLGTLPPKEALSNDQQLIFAKLRNEYGNTDKLWQQAEASGLSEQIPALKRTFALDELTNGHTLLVSALQTNSDAIRPESLEFLTALEPIDWIELVFEHGVPPRIELDRDNYIAQLQADVESKFSMRMLTKQLETKFIESERFPAREVLNFFEANLDFDIKAQHVEPYLDDTENQGDDVLREGLLQLQRIHVVTSNAYETGVLLDVGYSSATQIVNEGMPALELKVANQMSPERTAEVFSAAENIVTTVAVVATAYVSPSASGNAIHVIPAPSVTDKTLKKYPSLRSLFGDLDYCECRHCQSVLGPAAYLADLMRFLQRSKLNAKNTGRLASANYDALMDAYLEYAAGGTVLGVLLQRRPDLADLELSCENTNTKIPYIDLVLEILENAVALPRGVDTGAPAFAGIDINAEFVRGNVPDAVANALRETNIKVGKILTVTGGDSPLSSNSPSLNWIIKDGSRRWLVQHRKQQFIIFISGAWNFPVLDVAGAVASLKLGTLNAELEDRLSQGLPLDGAPQIQEVPISSTVQVWTANYTRAIAIKIIMDRMGAVELLKLDGTQIRIYQWPLGILQNFTHAFTSGTTSKINPNVARLLELPANETYIQTWNPTQNWWELRIKNAALFAHLLEGLDVAGLTYQNSSIREHLESSPENRNPAAYDILSSKNAVFPWALPFDLWLEETRAFLEALGIPRAHLIDIARPQSRLSEEAAALELLGLSKSEADLIAPAAASTVPWSYWGLAQADNTAQDHTAGFEWKGNWLEVLAHLSMLLQQSGLSYREYLDLVQTSFVGQPKLMLFPSNECKTSKIILTGLNETEFTDHLNRIHVFTRLWRKSGWSMRELDLALAAFGGQLTPTILQDLALMKRLHAGLGLPVSVLVACIDKLETQAWTNHTKDGSPIEPALYNSVFQRQSLRSLTGFDDFALEKLSNTIPPLSISTHAGFVAASLGIKPDQVKTWITGTPSLGIADSATLESLSRMYAAASLCRALQIAPDALPDIVTLLDVTEYLFRTLPVTTTADEQARARARAMLEFVERIRFVRESGFDFETLSYLLRHRVLPGKGSDASTKVEQQITKTLTELRAALQAGVVLGDVSADNVKRQLARLGWYPALIDDAMGPAGLAYQPGASIDISPPLATEPAIPLNLRSKFSYQKQDSTKGELKCTGYIKGSDFLSIENLNLFPSGLVAALETQYKQQLKDQGEALASLLQIIELPKIPTVTEAVTGLTALPVIPGALKDRLKFKFDGNSSTDGNLTLTGWLTKAEKDTVSDANLTAVVISLQAKALLEIPAPTPPQTLLEAEKLLREPDVEKRFRTILLRLVPRLEVDLLVAQLSGALGCDPQLIDTLLNAVMVPIINGRSAKVLLTDSEFLSSYATTPVERGTRHDQFAVIELLGKITTIANRLTIAPEQLDWVLGKSFTVMDVLALPTSATTAATAGARFDDWRKLVDLFHLRDVLPDGATRLAQVHEALNRADESTVRGVFAKAFELNRQQPADDACDVGLLNFNTTALAPNDYHNPSRLLELAQLLQVSKLLGAPCNDIKLLIQSAPTEPVAQLARTLFAASINADEFPERLRPISNRLRNLQRDALVAYLIHHDHLVDSNELFDRYLIDVEMGSCMLTSRIKQAISSVQLFVQRCLLNLERPATAGEPGVSPVSIDTQRWQWMKYYRVWEANRKVFLYPENWIEPELRDDKSEIFQSFESDLLQSELTHDTALVAFRKYLDKLGDVANLTVVSMFEEQTDRGTIVHLVGRDNSQPYKHYYRQWKKLPTQDFGTWTAWEEISVQVDSDHVVVFLLGGSVYLAWPTISGQGTEQNWQVRMNLGKRTASGWTKLKKGRSEISHPMIANKDERNSFAFRLAFNVPKNIAFIRCYGMRMLKGQVQSRPEIFTTVLGAPVGSRTLELNIRTLAKYTDPSGKSFLYVATDFKSECKVTYSSVGVILPGFKTMPLSRLNGGSGDLSRIFTSEEKPFFIEFDDITITSSANNQRYTSQPFSKKQSLAQNAFWSFDIVFDLQKGELPELDPNEDSSFDYLKSFKLADDDSLDIFSENDPPPDGHPVPLEHPQYTEHFMSGYREVGGTDALALGTEPSLNTTPGQYFIVQAQSDRFSTRPIWSYRDDRFSLLFWKSTTDAKYRVVPFSTEGMIELKSAVTKGRLLDAVALPLPGGTLAPNKLEVGTGIDFLHDVGTDIDSTNSNSVTQVKIDFGPVPSGIYNWEVFFHNPLLVATRLSQAQRFEEAQRWFHLIFDPTTNDATADPSRYWRFLPFRNAGPGDAIDELLKDLARTGGRLGLKNEIDEWAENPFRPHLIARHRLRSYQFAVVLKYLENLIAWGDQLFRRDTIEAINEATQLYVLAAKILGKRPASSPKTEASPKSYRDIYRKLDDFSNAWIPLEAVIATQSSNGLRKNYVEDNRPSTDLLNSLGSLYFCIPGNETLSEYWDTVGDRLFKIRHCMNIEGIERQLPLFEPPIDPALLIRATAAGLDLAAVLSDLQAPLPLYRFNMMVQKALELCGEVRALGNALLSALEKKDAEQLSLLRSSHEIQMLKLVRAIKVQQQEEAETNLEALRKTREITVQRYLNYQRLLGKQNIVVPAEGAAAALESSSLQLAPPGAGGGDTQGLALISEESGQLGWLNDANNFSIVAGIFNSLGGVAHAFPDFAVGAFGQTVNWGGSHIGNALNSVGSLFSILASNAGFQANRSSIMGGHQRRYDEWRFQSNTASKELEQIDKQIVANEIRIQIAEREIKNHDQQIENTQEVDEFMRDKFTSQQLYSWMVGQISSVYFRTYQLAHDMSKRAERAYLFELGLKESSFIEFGYWDSLKKGLLSGERLYLDLKRMEASYLDKNKREYEITKHVSLMQLDPVKLLLLRETGQCEVSLPEALLDMDFPGHYLRRIKSVSLTIPCVTGPYSTVPCTLTLLKHSVRHSSNASANYARDVENDDGRFIDSFGAIQSIVTSSAQNDSGMFETNLRDERYLPFEGAGVISSWRIELPLEFRQFNYDTISDVILHIRYTAREGGKLLKTSAVKNTEDLVKDAAAAGSVRLFSVRHEFPTEWAKFKDEQLTSNPKVFAKLTFEPKPEHYPYWSQGSLNRVKQADVFAETTNAHVIVSPRPDGKEIGGATESPELSTFSGNLRKRELASPPATPIETVTLYFNDKSMDNIWLALAWGK